MNLNSKIYIAGHYGLVGSAINRALIKNGYNKIIGKRSSELNLIDQHAVDNFFSKEKPDYVILAAAKVGGIHANNKYRGQFLYENLMIQSNIIHSSYQHNVKKLLFLGSSCIYPKKTNQPIKEEYLLHGALESTNEPYAIAKIAGIRMCDAYNRQYKTNFISAMPCNMYGPGDNYHLENSHVLPALIRRFHEAKLKNLSEVTCWGTGKPCREFLYSEDLGSACLFLLQNIDYCNLQFTDSNGCIQSHINIGSGLDISIHELAEKVKKIVNYKGSIKWDHSKPDGTMQKLMDSSKINKLGWSARMSLDKGIKLAYQDFLKNNL